MARPRGPRPLSGRLPALPPHARTDGPTDGYGPAGASAEAWRRLPSPAHLGGALGWNDSPGQAPQGSCPGRARRPGFPGVAVRLRPRSPGTGPRRTHSRGEADWTSHPPPPSRASPPRRGSRLSSALHCQPRSPKSSLRGTCRSPHSPPRYISHQQVTHSASAIFSPPSLTRGAHASPLPLPPHPPPIARAEGRDGGVRSREASDCQAPSHLSSP